MDTRKQRKKLQRLFSVALAAALMGLSITGASLMPNFAVEKAQAETPAPTSSLQSNPETVKTSPAEDRLITPTAYEEYLRLASPMGAAVTDDYTAIADGNVIYLYDRFRGEYTAYEHSANATLAMNQVTQLAFTETGDLYFIDGAPYLYVLGRNQLSNLSDASVSATNTKYTCNAFALSGNTIYTAHLSNTAGNLSYTTLDKLDTAHAKHLVEFKSSSKPTLTCYEGSIYYTHGSNLLKIDPTLPTLTPETICGFNNTVESLAICQGEVFITDMLGNFYAYNLSQLEYEHHAAKVTPNTKDERGGYKSLSLYEDGIYAVRNQSVRKYTVGEGFVGYEISADSDAENRLSGARASVYKQGKLYVADYGNSRISIYDSISGSYSVIPTPDLPHFVATTEDTVVAATNTALWLYTADEAQPLTFDGFNGNVVGVEGVYGKYYVVTDTNHYYVIEYLPLPNADDSSSQTDYAWQKTGGKEKTKKLTPTLLTSDTYGNLYVASVSGDVYRHTEAGFLSPADHGKEICSTLPISATELITDLNQNLYALKGNALYAYAYDAQREECAYSPIIYPLGKEVVYGQTTDTLVTSISFGIDSQTTYVIYDGNLTIATDAIPLPTVQSIDTQGIEQKIFSPETTEFKVIETAENAFLIKFDLTALHAMQGSSESQSFPYLSHGRISEARTALYLGEVGEYSVLAIFDKQTNEYGNYLTKTRYYVTEKSESDYLINYSPDEEKIGYLTNGLPLYKYPYLTDLLQRSALLKNQTVRIIGEINDLDYSYYKIEIESSDGETLTGFIPKPYVTFFDGTPKPSETQSYGTVERNQDSLWRMVYLLLGTAAICILLDLLILHRPNDE